MQRPIFGKGADRELKRIPGERAMASVSQIINTGFVAVVLLMTGCAQPPSKQLEAAQKAVDAARAAEAEIYAKDDFMKLEQEFAVAKDELAKQEKTFAIFRSYSEADRLLSKVVEDGGQVTAKASQNKEAAKTAALDVEQEAQQVVASAKELMANAPAGKERAAVESIKQDISGLEAGLGEVHRLLEKGDYRGAEAQARAVKEKGGAVAEEIRHAIEKTKGKKLTSRG
jgi:hypothetical protein